MAIEPIKGFYVHDEATDTDGIAKYDAGALDNLDRSLTERYRAPDSKAVGDRLSAVEAVADEANQIAERLNEGGLELKDEVLTENISAWLSEHPEATTTVEDGALTQSKLSNSLDAKKPSFYSTVSEMQEDEQYRLGATAISDGAVYTVRSAVEVNDPEDMVDPSVLYKYDGQYYHGGLTENDRQIATGYECVNGFAVFVAEYKNAYVTPEMFGVVGTDADLLEYAINNLADGGVLMLDKDYTLDRVITLTRLSSRKRITIMPLSENAKINMNGYYITGTENGNTGNILFFGVQFNGASTGIFDGDKLIRLYFLGCNFTSTGSIVFSLSNRARAYFQSIHFLQCTFRHIADYLIKLPYDTTTRLFDVSIKNSLIEWCNAGLMSCNTWYGVTVSGNCIEGFTTNEPLFKGMRVSNGFTVTDNYFESLNTVYFDFSTYTYSNPFVFAFENNSVVESTVMSIFSMPPKNGGSDSVFKISGNSFITDADNANKVTVFDVSNTTEKLDKWVIIGNQNFNGYMIWTNDTNNYIQSYSTIYTLLKSLEQTNGLVDMTPGSTKLITIYTTGNAITRSQLVIPITFPFIAPNTNYTYTVRNLAITGISSNADVTLISQDGQFDSGMDLRYIDTTNNPFTANIPYSVRIRLYITFG